MPVSDNDFNALKQRVDELETKAQILTNQNTNLQSQIDTLQNALDTQNQSIEKILGRLGGNDSDIEHIKAQNLVERAKLNKLKRQQKGLI